MTAMLGLDECDVWVGGRLGENFRKNADERIVLCVDQQRGHCDAHQNAGCGRAEVIVFLTVPLENLEMFERMGVSFPT